jgi:hypothetical protein
LQRQLISFASIGRLNEPLSQLSHTFSLKIDICPAQALDDERKVEWMAATVPLIAILFDDPITYALLSCTFKNRC